jgi:hypothetical protein
MSSSRPDLSRLVPSGPLPKAFGLALALALASLLSGCGGSDSSRSSAEIVPSSDPISSSSDTAGSPKLTWPGPNSSSEAPVGKGSESGAVPTAAKPCALVTQDEAAAILGEEVGVTEGKLGPTCIFASVDTEEQVTVVVEAASLAGLRGSAKGASRVQVGARTGWCLRHDSTSVAVPLAGGQTLSVTGPCSTASQFAEAALGRL